MAKRKRFGRVMVPALLLPLGLASFGAYALGLGNLRVHSALGQPLSASIELIGATPAEAELATIGLASAEAHRRLGIDSLLGGVALRFVVKVGSNGRSYVSVSSYQPVREPYIDFVVQAVSPTGQVARHYTILLDPVGATAAPAPALAPSAAWSPGVTPIPERAAPRPRPNPFANVGSPKAGAVYGPVPPGATLWAIARRVQPGGTGLDAVMSTIVRANPQAFINGDPARLKAGSRLAIPDAQALRGAPVADAQPAQETPPVDATAPAVPAPPAEQPQKPAESVEAAPAPDAEVRVLRGEDAKSATSPAAAPADASASGDRVQLLEEALDAAQQQNESLQKRMGSLEEQIRTLADLVKASPADQVSVGGSEQSAAPAVAGQAPASPAASPAVSAAAAPAQHPTEQAGGSAGYLTAAVAALGLGGLLLWVRRRKAAAEQPKSMFGGEPADATGAAVTFTPALAAGIPAPATKVEWVDPVVAQPVSVEVPAVASTPLEDGFGDPVDTQIDLLTAYVGMADGPSARQIYDEIQRLGNPAQKAQAAALLARLDA